MKRIFSSVCLVLVLGYFTGSIGQTVYSAPPLSTESEKGFTSCPDTVFKFLLLRKIVDLDLVLPAWLPVLGYDDITVLEGTVIPKPASKHVDTHVSPSDFPFHHYTHDFTFNVRPDSTEDARFTNLLSNQVIKDGESNEIIDTVLLPYVHCEWESGLGAYNAGNPCSELNNAGTSAGFYSSGHERRDRIWNWPTLGDWVHVEGLWLWDRGHPPARTEIHPARLVAIRRKLPELIKLKDASVEVYATKIDVYASGDGGALNNNRRGVPDYVRKVRMGDKDYEFRVEHIVPRPSPNAVLKYVVKTQKGDTFPAMPGLELHADGDGDTRSPFIEIKIPWKGKSDELIFGRTIYTYWDEGNGKPEDYDVTAYRVTLESLKFKKMKEALGKSEFRVLLAVNGQYIFLNEFIDVPNILTEGLGSTRQRKWKINQEFVVYLPEGKDFRVHAGGWEADAIDSKMGVLMDPYSPCNSATKEWMNKNLNVASPLRPGGCLDDHIGEIHALHSTEDIGDSREFESLTNGRKETDFCPCDNGRQKNVFKLTYTIEKIKHEVKDPNAATNF